MLVIRTNGSRGLIGRAAVVRDELERPYYFASYRIRFRIAGTHGLTEWLKTVWDTPTVRRQIEQVAATSAGQYNVNIGKLNELIIPLPPFEEQEQIVTEVERRMSVLREVEAEVEADLKRAFEGRLVEQDPSDEPAGELLARIRAERERDKPARRRARKPVPEEPRTAQASLFSDAN